MKHVIGEEEKMWKLKDKTVIGRLVINPGANSDSTNEEDDSDLEGVEPLSSSC